MVKRIIVTTRVPGFHSWPDAPGDVGYLANPHRHEFHVRCEYDVVRTDRELEFHQQLACLHQALLRFGTGPHGIQFGSRSCEMIAIELRKRFADLEYVQPDAIEIWEDGEHGARVEFGG